MMPIKQMPFGRSGLGMIRSYMSNQHAAELTADSAKNLHLFMTTVSRVAPLTPANEKCTKPRRDHSGSSIRPSSPVTSQFKENAAISGHRRRRKFQACAHKDNNKAEAVSQPSASPEKAAA